MGVDVYAKKHASASVPMLFRMWVDTCVGKH